MGFLNRGEPAYFEQASDNNGLAIRGLGERKPGNIWIGNALGVVSAAALLLFNSVDEACAVGVGAAEADSYIGQRLSVRIPLFSVANPNALSINFSSPQFGREGQSVVQAVLDRSGSQLAVKLSS